MAPCTLVRVTSLPTSRTELAAQDRLWSVDDMQLDRRRYLRRKIERGRLSQEEAELLELLPRWTAPPWNVQEHADDLDRESMYADVPDVSSDVEMDHLCRYLAQNSDECERYAKGRVMKRWSKVKRFCSKLLSLRFRRRRPADLQSQYNS